MRSTDPVALLCCVSEELLALFLGLVFVVVVLDRNGGVRKLNRGNMDDVSPNQKLLSPALDRVGRVAGRVSGSRNGADPRLDLLIAGERLVSANGDIGLQGSLVPFEHRPEKGLCGVFVDVV